MTMLPKPSMTFEMPAPKRRGRKADPYRYLKRMGDKAQASERLAYLQERSILLAAANQAWEQLPALKRALLSLRGKTPVSVFMDSSK